MAKKRLTKTIPAANPAPKQVPADLADKMTRGHAELMRLRTQLGEFTFQVESQKVQLLQSIANAEQSLNTAVRDAAIAVGINPDGPERYNFDFGTGSFVKG